MKRVGVMIMVLFGLLSVVSGAKAVGEKVILSYFQDAVNKVMYPHEICISNLTSKQITKYIVPNTARILADTIKSIYQKKHEDIGVEDILAALPPTLEKVFRKNESKLKKEVMDILENKAKN